MEWMDGWMDGWIDLPQRCEVVFFHGDDQGGSLKHDVVVVGGAYTRLSLHAVAHQSGEQNSRPRQKKRKRRKTVRGGISADSTIANQARKQNLQDAQVSAEIFQLLIRRDGSRLVSNIRIANLSSTSCLTSNSPLNLATTVFTAFLNTPLLCPLASLGIAFETSCA
jgi:hypothetical protein